MVVMRNTIHMAIVPGTPSDLGDGDPRIIVPKQPMARLIEGTKAQTVRCQDAPITSMVGDIVMPT